MTNRKPDLNQVLAHLGEDPELGGLNFPIIHIAAHGCKDGFELTSGELISWEMLSGYLNNLKIPMGLDAEDRGSLIVSMSSCFGLYGCQTAPAKQPSPYFLLLGPIESLDWPDGLTAWITFYHLFVKRNFELQTAINRMNLAAGFDRDIFGVISGHAMEQHHAKSIAENE